MRSLQSWIRRHLFITVGLLITLIVVLTAGSFALVHAWNPAPTAPSCGSLSLPLNGQAQYAVGVDNASASQIEQCFIQAYQHCQARSLNVTWMGVDSGSKSIFTIEKQGNACQISQSSQGYVVGFTNQRPPDIHTCQGIVQSANALTIKQCQGNGEVVIPRGESCGAVYSQNSLDANRSAENCFIQDYHRCYPAELSYEPSGTLGYGFHLSGSCKLTVFTSDTQSSSSCSDVLQQTDGLHFLNCGPRGDILVPAKP